METEKKQWTQPKLTVLVRSKREEAVLVACKGVGGRVTVEGWRWMYVIRAQDTRPQSLPLDPLVFGSWESVREGGVYGLCRGLQGV